MNLEDIAKQYKKFKTECDEEYLRRVKDCNNLTEATIRDVVNGKLPLSRIGNVNPLPVDDSFEAFLLQQADPTTD